MKKIFFLFVYLPLLLHGLNRYFPFPTQIEEEKEEVLEECVSPPEKKRNNPLGPCVVHGSRWSFEFKPGVYRFDRALMREMYGDWNFSFKFELDYKLRRPLSIWIDGGYLSKNGYSVSSSPELAKARTDISIANATVGFKGALFLHRTVSLYAGLGPRYFVLWNHLDSFWVQTSQNSQGIGAAFLGGLRFEKLRDSYGLFVDLFADYSLKLFSFSPNQVASVVYDINIDGLAIGAGLGYRF